MKVILNQDVPNLGEEGDVKEVKRGYARNYLIPQGMVVPFTKQNQAIFENKKALIEKKKLEKKELAKNLKDKLETVELFLKMPAGDTGKLFGSVTSATIAEELEKEGFSVERKKIELPEHTIKMSGSYAVKIKLYGNEVAQIKVSINTDKKTKEQETVSTEPAQETKAEEEIPAGTEQEE